MKKITAKFKSECAETGKPLKKGSEIIYDNISRVAYHMESTTAKNFLSAEGSHNVQENHDAALVAAQENAFFDNFCQENNI